MSAIFYIKSRTWSAPTIGVLYCWGGLPERESGALVFCCQQKPGQAVSALVSRARASLRISMLVAKEMRT